jgi:NADPH:quinone reductase-like Zn-dependent oxidoreductase
MTQAPAVMKAVRLYEPGETGRFLYEDAPVPEPGVGDALVRVHAASFTPTELAWPSSWVDRLGHDRRPIIPGHEFCGTVEALGYGTTGVGDGVFGVTDWYRDGAFADYVAVEARNLAPMPPSLTDEEAAALPLAGLTAWQALFDHAGLIPAQTVLIQGAGGGVGALAVQLARAVGARVIAAGKQRAAKLTSELGADEFIDIERGHFEDVAGAVDVVFDLVGGELLDRSWSTLKEGGVLVSAVEDPAATANQRPECRSVFFVVEPSRAQLIELSGRIGAGELRPVVGEIRPLAGAEQAFFAKQRGGIPGKIVVRVMDHPPQTA